MTQTATVTPPRKLGFSEQMRSFPPAFWVANVIELVERFSFYGVRMIAAVYITESASKGGLEFTSTDKGVFFGTWALIQCLLPMFTGAFADRYGYRRSLFVAFGINIVGYALMAYLTSWWGFMLACCLIGTGTAIFKPPLHGTLAHCVNESNSSLGWGMFYQVVNIGAFIGPLVCGYLRLLEWRYAFLAASGIIFLNIAITALFLKDYAQGRETDASGHRKGPAEVFTEALAVMKDLRFVAFLAIFSGFWFMFMQLTDQLSIFVNQWVNSNDVAQFLARLTGLDFFKNMAAGGGQVNPEWIVNVDAGSIIILVLPITYLAGRFRPISTMIVGMFVSCVGLLLAGSVMTGWACILAILVFAVGEMICSPKFSEYVGLMAPPDKKALYMGYSNIPFAVGWSGANYVGGPLYDRVADKFELARRYLVDVAGSSAETVRALPRDKIMPTLADALGQTEAGAREVLWNRYHPQTFFYIVISVGLLSTLAMVGYHFWLLADARKRAAASAT